MIDESLNIKYYVNIVIMCILRCSTLEANVRVMFVCPELNSSHDYIRRLDRLGVYEYHKTLPGVRIACGESIDLLIIEEHITVRVANRRRGRVLLGAFLRRNRASDWHSGKWVLHVRRWSLATAHE